MPDPEASMDMEHFFASVEATFLAKFQESAAVHHSGDLGENREEILREFLTVHLPGRYGVAKGQIVNRSGALSHSADIVIYDSLNCPVLYSGRTVILPVEGVYGIIEVKSTLGKDKFLEASKQIENFKRLASQQLSVIRTREYMTIQRPSRPFGIVFSYGLHGNSLESLTKNFTEECRRIHHVNYFTNLIAVLGAGLIYHQKADLAQGQKTPLLDTDEFVNLMELVQKRTRLSEPIPEVVVRAVADELGAASFGRFFVYLLIMLARIKLNVPDLGQYLDPDMTAQIVRES
jgi:uncharacterized protein DUF6602